MPATNVTDLLFEAKPRLTGKVGAGGVASTTATTIPHTFVGLTEGNCYIVTANRTNAGGTTKNPVDQTETFIGKVSGANFINCVRAVEGVAQAWSADTVLEILFTASGWNKLIEALEVEHNADGKHKNIASGVEIDTGTDNEKIVTPKAIADSKVVKETATQTLTNKTLTSPTITGTALVTADGLNVSSLYRQAIINGNFDVWQRGTSFTLANMPASYTADRFFISQTGYGVGDELITRESTSPPAGSRYYFQTKQYKASGFVGGHSRIITILEAEVGQLYAGQTATLSFKYRVPTSYTNQWYMVGRYDTDDATLSSSACNSAAAEELGSSLFATTALTNSTTWTDKSITFTVPSNCKRIMLVWYSISNAVNGATFNLAQVQLNKGSIALPFQPKSYADEFANCERYYKTNHIYRTSIVTTATATTTLTHNFGATGYVVSNCSIWVTNGDTTVNGFSVIGIRSQPDNNSVIVTTNSSGGVGRFDIFAIGIKNAEL